jgi:hypothetical protein
MEKKSRFIEYTDKYGCRKAFHVDSVISFGEEDERRMVIRLSGGAQLFPSEPYEYFLTEITSRV